MPSHSQILRLYRTMLKQSARMSDYNFRNYAIRRTKSGFREGCTVGGDEAEQLYNFGLQQLAVVHRQSIISNLFPGITSVMTQQRQQQ
jgi:hypothetical protein